MTLGFGPDFLRARQGELYVARSGQPLWLAVGFVVVLFGLLSIVQTVFGLVIWPFLPVDSSASDLTNAANVSSSSLEKIDEISLQMGLAKAAIVGLLPSSLLVAWAAWWIAGVNNATGDRGIPLHLPKLGAGGWAVTIAGLIVLLWTTFALTFWILGIDPATYAPSKDGLNDAKSAAGMVEKIMADLADEPVLFALALPGVTLAVPIVEEFIFRGAVFSALRNSWFGKTGAVVITAAVWSVIHAFGAPWLFVFIIFIMGLTLGWLLLRFGSLTVTIICHAAWNMVSSLVIFGGQAPT